MENDHGKRVKNPRQQKQEGHLCKSLIGGSNDSEWSRSRESFCESCRFHKVYKLGRSWEKKLIQVDLVDLVGSWKGRVVVTIPEMSRSRNLASGDGGGGKWQRISLNGGVVSSGMAVNYACEQTNQPASPSHQLFPVCKNLCFEKTSSSSTNLLWSVPPQCCHVPSHHDHLRLQVPSKLPKGEASWWRMDGSGSGRRTVIVDVKSIGYIPWADSVNPSRYRVSKLADRLA